jgi:Ubiquitin family.
LITGLELKEKYAETQNVPTELIRLFFGGKEINYSNSLAGHLIQSDMVVTAFIKTIEAE